MPNVESSPSSSIALRGKKEIASPLAAELSFGATSNEGEGRVSAIVDIREEEGRKRRKRASIYPPSRGHRRESNTLNLESLDSRSNDRGEERPRVRAGRSRSRTFVRANARPARSDSSSEDERGDDTSDTFIGGGRRWRERFTLSDIMEISKRIAGSECASSRFLRCRQNFSSVLAVRSDVRVNSYGSNSSESRVRLGAAVGRITVSRIFHLVRSRLDSFRASTRNFNADDESHEMPMMLVRASTE